MALAERIQRGKGDGGPEPKALESRRDGDGTCGSCLPLLAAVRGGNALDREARNEGQCPTFSLYYTTQILPSASCPPSLVRQYHKRRLLFLDTREQIITPAVASQEHAFGSCRANSSVLALFGTRSGVLYGGHRASLLRGAISTSRRSYFDARVGRSVTLPDRKHPEML